MSVSHLICVLWDAGPAPQLPPSMPLGLPPTNPAGDSLLALLADLWALCACGCVCICIDLTHVWLGLLSASGRRFARISHADVQRTPSAFKKEVGDRTDVICRCCTRATWSFCLQLHAYASRPTSVAPSSHTLSGTCFDFSQLIVCKRVLTAAVQLCRSLTAVVKVKTV